jgi:hypothetical protein
VLEEEVAPTQGNQLAPSEAGVGGREEDGGVLVRLGCANEGHHFLGREEIQITRVAPWPASDVGDRVRGEVPDSPRTLEDAVP